MTNQDQDLETVARPLRGALGDDAVAAGLAGMGAVALALAAAWGVAALLGRLRATRRRARGASVG